VGLVSELVDDSLDLTVPLQDHLLSDLLLELLLLVVELSLVGFHPLLALELVLLLLSLDFLGVLPFELSDLLVGSSSFSLCLLVGALVGLLELVLEGFFLALSEGFQTVVLAVDVVLPAVAFVVELILQSLVLVVEFLLGLLSLLVERLFFLSNELLSHLLELFLLVQEDILPLLPEFALVKLLEASDLFLVAFDDPLDFRLEALDGLSSDLLDLVLLPFLLPDSLRSSPSILVLLQFDLQPVFKHFLLAVGS